jgi:hypothetical protein
VCSSDLVMGVGVIQATRGLWGTDFTVFMRGLQDLTAVAVQAWARQPVELPYVYVQLDPPLADATGGFYSVRVSIFTGTVTPTVIHYIVMPDDGTVIPERNTPGWGIYSTPLSIQRPAPGAADWLVVAFGTLASGLAGPNVVARIRAQDALPSELIRNGTIETGLPYWGLFGTGVLSTSATAHGGTKSLSLQKTSAALVYAVQVVDATNASKAAKYTPTSISIQGPFTHGGSITVPPNVVFVPVTPGATILLGAWAQSGGGTPGVTIEAFDASFASLGMTTVLQWATGDTGWTFKQSVYTVPAGAAYVVIAAAGLGAATYTALFDDLHASYSGALVPGILNLGNITS